MLAALFRDTPALWAVIGSVGIAAFSGRFLVQWIVSEKKRESVIPRVFWILSLVGSVFNFVYAYLRGDPPLVVLQAVNFGIYVRNLLLLRHGKSRGVTLKFIVPSLVVVLLILVAAARSKLDWGAPVPWLVCGFIGQILWNCRFIVQWVVSERHGESVMPTAFWWISLGGDAFLLAYALHTRDPIYILQFLVNPIVYVRNLMLISGKKRRDAAERG